MNTSRKQRSKNDYQQLLKWASLLMLVILAISVIAFQKNSGSAAPPHTAPERPARDSAFTRDSLLAHEYMQAAGEALEADDYGQCRAYVGKAVNLFEKLIEQSSDSTLWADYTSLLFQWAQINGFFYEDTQGALRTFERGYRLALQRFGPDYPGLSFFITKIGHIYASRGDFGTALIYHRRAFEHRIRHLPEEDYFYLGAYINLIYGLIGEGHYEEALKYLSIANSIAKKHHKGSNLEKILYDKYGQLYQITGKYDLAKEHYQKSLAITQASGNTENQIAALSLLGDLASERGLREEAMSYYEDAREISERFYGRDHPKMAYFYAKTADFLIRNEQYERALTYAEKALAATITGFDRDSWRNGRPEGMIHESIAGGYALEMYTLSLTRLAEQKERTQLLRVALNVIEFLLQHGDHVLKQFKSERSQKGALEVRNLWIEQGIDICTRLFEHSGDTSFLVKAFQFSEKGKAYALLRNIRISQERAESGIPKSLKEADREIRRSIKEVEKQIWEAKLEKGRAVAPEILRLETQLFTLKERQDSLIRANQRQYPRFWRLRQALQPPTLSEVQQKLNAGDLLIEYFYGEENIYTFALTADDFQYFTVAIDSVLTSAIRALGNDVKAGPQNEEDLFRNSRLVFRKLVQPAISRRTVQRIQIIPDGPLYYVPFEILQTEDVDEDAEQRYRNLPYLLREFPIAYEYSGALLMEHEPGPAAIENYLGVAPRYPEMEIPERNGADSLYAQFIFRNVRGTIAPLEYNIPEIESVSGKLAGESLAGDAATERNFKEKVKEYDILHLAMHAHTNDLDPDYSWLIFANPRVDPTNVTGEDGFLHAYEITNMELKAQLAVLSACNTGAGQFSRGEGVMSLARAFKYAGCPNVVMSLWPANDASTKEIITAFFDNLKAGMNKDEALRQAKLAFLQSTPNELLTNPFYWSGFVLVGDHAPIVFSTPRNIASIWTIAGLTLAGAALWFFRRKRRHQKDTISRPPGEYL